MRCLPPIRASFARAFFGAALAAALLLAPSPAEAASQRPGGTTNSVPTSPVPEPTSMLLFSAGLLVVASAVRRQRRQD